MLIKNMMMMMMMMVMAVGLHNHKHDWLPVLVWGLT